MSDANILTVKQAMQLRREAEEEINKTVRALNEKLKPLFVEVEQDTSVVKGAVYLTIKSNL